MAGNDRHPAAQVLAFASAVARRRGPALCILSPSLQLLYTTQRARSLLAALSARADPRADARAPGLPAAALELCREVSKLLTGQRPSRDRRDVELVRMIGTAPHQLRLYGLGIPHALEPEADLLLLMLEEPRLAQDGRHSVTCAALGFTAQDEAVVAGLRRGWTNKEIATHLKISPHTVRGHLQRLMIKTDTTTRTGLLARLFYGDGSALPGGGHLPGRATRLRA